MMQFDIIMAFFGILGPVPETVVEWCWNVDTNCVGQLGSMWGPDNNISHWEIWRHLSLSLTRLTTSHLSPVTTLVLSVLLKYWSNLSAGLFTISMPSLHPTSPPSYPHHQMLSWPDLSLSLCQNRNHLDCLYRYGVRTASRIWEWSERSFSNLKQ